MKILQTFAMTCSALMLATVPLTAPAAAAQSGGVKPAAVSQCPSNQFCMWNKSDYQGTVSSSSGAGVTKNLGTTVKSFWNNRSKAVRLYNTAGSASTCYAAGVKKGSLSTAYQKPAKVTLLSGTSC